MDKPNPKHADVPGSQKNASSMRRTNMYFTAPQMEKLSIMSESTGLSVAELVRRAVDEYLHRNRSRKTDQ